MKARTCLLSLAALFTLACDDGGDGSMTPDAAVDPGADMGPELPNNFIPTNANRCDPESAADLEDAYDAIQGLVDYQRHAAVRDLELCHDGAYAGCGPCPDNPLGDLMDAIDASGWIMDQGVNNPEESIRAYWARALSYPVRDLIVSTGGRRLALSQSIAVPVGANETEYALQAEGLLESCRRGVHTWSQLPAGDRFETDGAPVTFDFLVPLVEQLPRLEDFSTLEGVIAWAASALSMEVHVASPSVAIDRSGANDCMMMTGYVSIESLAADLGSEVIGIIEAGGFEDPDVPGYVRGTIRGRLEDVTVYNGAPAMAGLDSPSRRLFMGDSTRDFTASAPDCAHRIADVDVAPGMGDTVDMTFTVTQTCSESLDLGETRVMIAIDAEAGRFASMPESIMVGPADQSNDALVTITGVPAGAARARLFSNSGAGWSEAQAWPNVPTSPGLTMAP